MRRGSIITSKLEVLSIKSYALWCYLRDVFVCAQNHSEVIAASCELSSSRRDTQHSNHQSNGTTAIRYVLQSFNIFTQDVLGTTLSSRCCHPL
jgi:hypothetical protein